MKAAILAGGRGSRLAEETGTLPKPLVEVGGRPIIWHIMRIYEAAGISDFVVCAGYRGYLLKEYFANLALHNADVTVDVASGSFAYLGDKPLSWTVTIVDTGLETMTAGRLRRARDHLASDEPFCMTYGDGLADVDVREVVDFHASHELAVTMTAVRPRARFGMLELDGDRVAAIHEKDPGREAYVNGGFFVVEPRVLDLIEGDASIWESQTLPQLAAAGQLAAFRHDGFWQPMDTLWEKEILNELWQSGRAPWSRP